ncbi:hypothetical protein B0H19DRAFT_1077256 [Mycena capillaripes]|nr:hypothetical protein B0H19DRAFT_1077256 [Mycena capillaripes]
MERNCTRGPREWIRGGRGDVLTCNMVPEFLQRDDKLLRNLGWTSFALKTQTLKGTEGSVQQRNLPRTFSTGTKRSAAVKELLCLEKSMAVPYTQERMNKANPKLGENLRRPATSVFRQGKKDGSIRHWLEETTRTESGRESHTDSQFPEEEELLMGRTRGRENGRWTRVVGSEVESKKAGDSDLVFGFFCSRLSPCS